MSTPGDVTKRPLPPGWRWMKLGEVCEERTGVRDPRQQPDSQFRYVDITSVDNKTKRIVEPKTLFGRDAPSRARQVIRTGDVLVATTRPNLNAVALVPPELDNEICSTGFCVLRARKGLNPAFLFAWVQTPDFVQGLVDLVKGALYPAVTDNQVRAQEIPLPPLAEQERIAAILREQMAAVERARRAAEEQLEAARALPAAFLRCVFPRPGQPLPPGWRWVKLGEVCALVGESINPQSFPEETFAHYSIPAFDAGAKPVSELGEAILSNKILFRKDAVLFSKLNPRIARVWHVQDNNSYRRICSTEFLPLLPDPEHLDAEFLVFCLQEPNLIEALRSRVTAATKSRERLKPDIVLAASIPLPPLAEQQRIAAILREQMAAAERVRKAIEAQLQAINKLPAAILRKAFSGEL